ncbi:MAG: ABC transporter permease, partial [Planctomycetota bacterium]
MYQLTEGSGQPGNIILLSQGVTDEAFSNLGFSDTGDIERQKGVRRGEDGRPLCSKETYVVVNQPIIGAPPGAAQRRFVQVRGIEDPQLSAVVHDVELFAEGQWFSPAGVRSASVRSAGVRAAGGTTGETDEAADETTGEATDGTAMTGETSVIEAVLGEGVARELGRDKAAQELTSVRAFGRLDTGDTFTLGGRTWLITGVMKSSGSTFDSEIWAKRQIVGQMFGKISYTSIIVRAESAKIARKLTEFFNNEFKQAAVQATLETEYFASLSKTNEQFLFAIIVVAAFMAIGGVFGVTNTMLAAVAQRAKDIGVLRIVGYSGWQVLLCFLIESLLIAVIGGALGCGLGYLVNGWTATSIVGSGQGGGKSVVLTLIVDFDIVLKCMGLSVAMGIIGGLYPAFTTFRAKPLEILR